MSKLTEIIRVDKVNKYGVRVGEKQYNYSKKYSGEVLEVGKTYEVEIYTSATGAKYINSAKLATLSTSAVSTVVEPKIQFIQPVERSVEPKTVANGYGTALSASEKDTRILVQGILQAVLQSPGLASGEPNEDYLKVVKDTTIDLVEFVRNFGK